ncbi:MAG: methyltransferase domain-containing protein [Acidobacteria bacterium]|nr:methyltransferase domain-containing protein [Acidobacteriota bacterium]
MKLAVFTPLRPVKSGIADYSAALLPEIARHAEVTVFVDGAYEPEPFPPELGIRVRNFREYRPEEFDETLYQFGNNPFHIYVYDTALRHPGVALLHELNLHHLVADATIKRDDWDGYLREVAYEGTPEDVAFSRRVRALEVGPDYEGLLLNKRVLEAAKAVIVHSDYMVERVREAAAGLPVHRIPHGAWIPEVDRLRYRAKLGLDETNPLIGIFGFLKPYKRIRESLRAMRRLVRVEPRARMILVGEEHPEFPVRRMVDDLGLSEYVRHIDYAPIDDFVQYLGACDICLNLRYPSVGETSGTLLRALGLGRAVIVSDVGAFADLPDEVCLKVPVGPGETDLIFEYLNLLIARPEVRQALGARARDYVARECAWGAVGLRFAETLRNPLLGGAEDLLAGVPEKPAEEPEVVDAIPEPAPPPPEPAQEAASTEDTPDSAELAEEIRSWVHDRANDAVYVETHLTRLVRTLELTPPGGADDSALEMGAYLHITPALQTRLGYGEVRGCYLGPVGKIDRRRVTSSSGAAFECEIDHFDAEKDRYPYPEDRFATVLCCELLEHLYEDPMHLMQELNRVIRPGGHLVLSTPNVCSRRAIAAMLLNYHPGLFHHYVIPDEEGKRDPRHAREYAPRDVQALFEAAGFEIVRLETAPYLERRSLEHAWVDHLLDRYELPKTLRDDAIFAVGRKVGPVRSRYPADLYVGGE